MKRLIYMDNAATSFPKPPEVTRVMVRFMEEVGAGPGRSGHELAVEAGRIVSETRGRLARLFNVGDPNRIVFTANAIYDAVGVRIKDLPITVEKVLAALKEKEKEEKKG